MPPTSLKHFIVRVATALLTAGSAALPSAAADSGRDREAAIVARVLSYERSLEARAGTSVDIAVVFKAGDANSEANARSWLQGFASLSSIKIKDRPVSYRLIAYKSEQALTAAVVDQGLDVILVSDGLARETGEIARVARAHRVLTVANRVEQVERDFTLCVQLESERHKIFVNLSSAALEHIQFSSHLLKLATTLR
jgi:hypothetical protein